MTNWRTAAGIYSDRRVLSMLFLGFSSGLPFGVLAEPLSAWLAESGVGKTGIGLFALVGIPYSLKFLWAPLMDRLALPILGRRIGRRRGWALLTQVALLAAIIAMGRSDPVADIWLTAAFALAVSFASASQDIVVDAYRVESLTETTLAAGAATAVFGWRLGQVGGGAAGLIMADVFPWSAVFAGMGLLVLVGIAAILINPEPAPPETPEAEENEARAEQFLERKQHVSHRLAGVMAWFYVAAIRPFSEFMTRKGWWAVLLFIMLYKFGDAVLAVMKVPFFLEIGFTKTEIAAIAKVFGFNAIIAGGFLGGLVLARFGIMRGLVICGVLMAASNLVFIAQARAGPNQAMLAVTIAVENITTGMGTTAFVAYLSSLCNTSYTATQYALLTSLMAFSRTVMSSGGGWLADRMDWTPFFIVTTLAALPGLALLLWIIRRYPPKEAKET